MTETTEKYAETTVDTRILRVIDDVLNSLRISGSVLLRETYAAPWSITIPDSERLAEILDVDRGTRVVAFHLVELGHCRLNVAGDDEYPLVAGDLAICFGGANHRLSLGRKGGNIDLIRLIKQGYNPRDPNKLRTHADTALLCGIFLLQDTALNPLFAALPPVLRTSLPRAGDLHNLSGVARLIAQELDRRAPAGGYIVARLLEVLCAEAVRAHVATVAPEEANWLRGIKDHVVGRSIAAIHSRPGHRWSVQRLAAGVSISPSRFATRFTEAVGMSPMAYVATWRMHIACRSLKSGRQSVERIAASLGYESQAAFSRSFRKHLGLSPAAWRAREVSQEKNLGTTDGTT